jgi:hypothetical protein
MLKLIFSIEYRSYKLTIVVYMHVIYNFNHSLCILHMETTKKKKKEEECGRVFRLFAARICLYHSHP